MKIFFSLTRSHSQMCIRIYIFNFKKKQNKKKLSTKQNKTRRQKKRKRNYRKANIWKTYRDKRISFANLLCVLELTWSSSEFLLVVHMNLIQFICSDRIHSICYATATDEVHIFLNKNKIKSLLLRYIFVYLFLVYICVFVAANLL